MTYKITHHTTYTYSKPVSLNPHVVQLRPRSDAFQKLLNFSLEVSPEPLGIADNIDLEGNSVIKIWFPPSTESEQLEFKVISEVETYCKNPFNYLVESWVMELPIIDYPALLFRNLQPYLPEQSDPIISQMAQEIWSEVNGQTLNFLNSLNQKIYESCQYIIREKGRPFPPGVTWMKKTGSCRDLAVVFMEACRAMNLATRFVSGYQEGDLDKEHRELHAWAEVYLPGAGWRGYDPTQGLAVSDGHIALVASAIPQSAAPIQGSFRGVGATSEMTFKIIIDKQTSID